jgi:hypothetical protein
MIGGTDVVLWVRDDVPIADVVFRTVRRHWPDMVYQNPDDESVPFLRPGPSLPKPAGPEYFIYKDAAAARSWDEHGAVPENHNTMLYVIEGKRRHPDGRRRSLTLVCGELVGDMKAIIEEIEAGLRDFDESVRDGHEGHEGALDEAG